MFQSGEENVSYENVTKKLEKILYENIVLSGWKWIYPGINTRLEKEMIQLTPITMKIKVIDVSERKYLF